MGVFLRLMGGGLEGMYCSRGDVRSLVMGVADSGLRARKQWRYGQVDVVSVAVVRDSLN